MSCSAFVHIKYTKELEQKIKKIPGIIPQTNLKKEKFERIRVPNESFSRQHKKEDESHKWVKSGNLYNHYPENQGEWEYLDHGFTIWINFEGDIVLVADCHWNYEHGLLTVLDLKRWIKDELGDIEIKKEQVS